MTASVAIPTFLVKALRKTAYLAALLGYAAQQFLKREAEVGQLVKQLTPLVVGHGSRSLR